MGIFFSSVPHRVRRKWTAPENEAIRSAFGSQIQEKRNVRSIQIQKAKLKFPILKTRTEPIIRTKINNIIKGKEKF